MQGDSNPQKTTAEKNNKKTPKTAAKAEAGGGAEERSRYAPLSGDHAPARG
jgi:hypothetical protein